jgi:hypothetical protein
MPSRSFWGISAKRQSAVASNSILRPGELADIYPKPINSSIEQLQIAKIIPISKVPGGIPAYLMQEMCFFNQMMFSCGDWTWTCFVSQCVFGRNIGGTCGIKLVHAVENVNTICPLCDNVKMISLRQNANAERRENIEATNKPTISLSGVITTADEAISEMEIFREI